MRRAFAWRKFGRTVVIVGIIFLLSGMFAWGINNVFTVRNIVVEGIGLGIEVDQSKLSKNLIFFPVDQVTRQILNDYPRVGSVTITKKYPDTLVVRALPRKPFVIAGIENETYALDDNGVVLIQYPSQKDLPRIAMAMGPLQLGTTVTDSAVMAAVNFLRQTQTVIDVSEIIMHDNTSLQAKTTTLSILFSQRTPSAVLARTLQTLIAGFRIKGKLPTTIDLRFDKPVVTF